LTEIATSGDRFFIEELLEGEELSVFAVCDGHKAVALEAARDYKRAGDGDTGPNTGGMGSYSPVAGIGPAQVEELVDTIHRPVLEELAARGAAFSGLLYAGVMLTADGPRVLEFNCRFGDPETQSVLPRLESDLLGVLAGAATGDLEVAALSVSSRTAVTVVLAAGGYPEAGDTGSAIDGIEQARELGALVFHAGTALRDDRLVTNGGRILGVTGVGADIAAARDLAYSAVDCISFDGARYRRDIALV
jgi:phosphoribosylamine--glycine ligase